MNCRGIDRDVIPALQKEVEGVTVSSRSFPLFANLDSYSNCPEVKTSLTAEQEEKLYPLESLLDRDNTESETFGDFKVSAIPFFREHCAGAVSLTSDAPQSFDPDSLVCSKLYLVMNEDIKADTCDVFVVTMVPEAGSPGGVSYDEISYLDKGHFSGVILYSDLDGTLLETLRYREGRITYAIPVPMDEFEAKGVGEGWSAVSLSTYPGVSSETKVAACAVVKAMIHSILDSDDCGGGGGSAGGAGGGSGGGVSGGSSGGNGGGVGKYDPGLGRVRVSSMDAVLPASGVSAGGYTPPYINTYQRLQYYSTYTVYPPRGIPTSTGGSVRILPSKEAVKFTVSLSSVGEGSTSGSGRYAKGAPVICKAVAASNPSPVNEYWVFSHWTGDLSGSNSHVPISVLSDVTATAYFINALDTTQRRPCYNAQTNVMNPMAVMAIAPTDSGILDRGIFNLNMPGRYSGKHQGIDLAGSVGTPIYAPADGKITGTIVTCQPNRIGKNKYPEDYEGDENDAGNRFSLECEINGSKITYSFWHLQADNPMAVNPRTGKTFKRNDRVYQGDIIAYVGRTGNAGNVKNTHLHLGVRNSSGRWVDPGPYLNGSVLKNDDDKVAQAKFVNVKCDKNYELY